MEKSEPSHITLLMGMENSATALENRQLLKMLNIRVSHGQFSSLVYSQENRKHVHADICTQMFMIAIFIIAPKWKQTRCPPTDKWINKIQMMEYYSSINRLKHSITRFKNERKESYEIMHKITVKHQVKQAV